jgi:hypothetical protein
MAVYNNKRERWHELSLSIGITITSTREMRETETRDGPDGAATSGYGRR